MSPKTLQVSGSGPVELELVLRLEKVFNPFARMRITALIEQKQKRLDRPLCEQIPDVDTSVQAGPCL